MDKRFSLVFLLVSSLFFFFIVGLTGYRIEDARRQNATAARGEFSHLVEQTGQLRESTGGYDAPQFAREMREMFDGEKRLLLLAVHSPSDGILYLVTRNRIFLKQPEEITPQWRGTPRYQVNRGYELLLGTALTGNPPDATMDAIYIIMGREDLYPIVRDDLFLFLAFLLVCGVVVLIATSVQQEPIPGRAPPSEGWPARPSVPESRPDGPAAAAAEVVAEAGVRPSAREARPLTSPRTGLSWGEHLVPRLKAELARAAASDQDLALARLRIDAPFADGKLPLVHAEVGRMLREAFPLHELLFETGSDSCAILLPDADIDAAVRSMEDFRRKVRAAVIEGRGRTVSVGVSSRGGRLIAEATLLEEADTALAKASREGGDGVIGFRADPARFREALAVSLA